MNNAPGCTKPDCNCVEKAIEANGGNEIKTGYTCLHGRLNDEELKSEFQSGNTDGGILSIGGTTMIFNGGEALYDCPEDWDEAHKIEAEFNKEFEEAYGCAKWEFDCGFKLDFDGSIMAVSSRFYPPKSHYGKGWDGNMTIYLFGDKIAEKKFETETLPQLKAEVDAYIKSITDKIKIALKEA